MKRALLVLGSVLASGALVITLWLGSRSWIAPETGVGSAVVAEHGLAGEREGGLAQRDGVDPSLGSAAGQRREMAAADRDDMVITGRCLQAEDGQPLAGCRVVAADYRWSWEQPPPSGEHLTLDLRTDAAGRFRFQLQQAPQAPVRLLALRAGRLPVRHQFAYEKGKRLVVPDFRLQPGTDIRVRMADSEGRRVPGVGLRVQRTAPERPAIYLDGHTDAQGELVFPHAVPAGAYRISVAYRRLLSAPDLQVKMGERSKTVQVRVQALDPNACISGRLLDRQGRPTTTRFLVAADANRRRVASCYPAPGGLFTMVRASRRKLGPVRLFVMDIWAGSLPSEPATDWLTWGTKDVQVVLDRSSQPVRTEVVVLSGADRRPVREFTVVTHPDPIGDAQPGVTRTPPILRRPAPGLPPGTIYLEQLPVGRHLLTVLPGRDPKDAELGVIFDQRVRVSSQGNQRIEVVLPVRRMQDIRVVDDQGQPVSGSRAEFLESRYGKPTAYSPVLPLAQEMAGVAEQRHRRRIHSSVVQLHTRLTGADGRVRLCGYGDRHLWLRVTGDHVTRLIHRPQLTGEPLVVRVESGGVVRGRFVPAAELVGMCQAGKHRKVVRPWVWLFGPGGAFPPNPTRVRLAEDGSFVIRHVPAGTWKLKLHHYLGGSPVLRCHHHSGALRVSGNVVDLGAIPLSSVYPGSLAARVFLNGKPLANRRLRLVSAPDEPSPIVETSADGGFVAKELKPGVWRIEVLTRGRRTLSSLDTVRVVSSANSKGEFRILERQVEVTVVGLGGKPLVGCRLHVVGVKGRTVQSLRSDAQGVVRFAHCVGAPCGLRFLQWGVTRNLQVVAGVGVLRLRLVVGAPRQGR